MILVIPYRLFGSGAAAIRVKIEHIENTNVCCGGDEGEIEHIENTIVCCGGDEGEIEHIENRNVCCGGDEGEIEHIENRNVRLGGGDEGKIEHIENRNIPLGGGAESHRRCTAQTESRIPIFLVPDFCGHAADMNS